MIRTMTLDDTVARMRSHGIKIGKDTLADGIAQGQYPFGICIQQAGSRRRIFQIYESRFDRWVDELDDRSGGAS